MDDKISRRALLGAAAGAAAATVPGLNWIFKIESGQVVVAAAKDAGAYKPIFFNRKEMEQLAVLVEAIIPRTDTPGARDARVHEFIDLSITLESDGRKKNLREGLVWFDKHCKRTTGKSTVRATEAQIYEALDLISDNHAKHPDLFKPGVSLFRDLKNRTVFGYYTSREGWTQELGRPETVHMTAFRGCTG